MEDGRGDSQSPTVETVELPKAATKPARVGLRVAAGMLLAAGTTIKHHEIVRPLGRGGMGQVYLARDLRLGRLVALKFFKGGKHTQRLIAEARTTARLTHENIVAIYDIDEHDGVSYLVLEYIAGQTLQEWLNARAEAADDGESASAALPVGRAVELMIPVVRALVCAHEAGIVHRDLKPSNVILAKSGAVKVLDFGIAKLACDAAPAHPGGAVLETDPLLDMTADGMLVGSPAYMSPEQWGAAQIDARSDLWAVGVMLHSLATGRHPLPSLSTATFETVADLSLPVPSVRQLRPDIGKLGAIIDRCLIKRKEDRIDSAQRLLTELEAIAQPALRSDGEANNPYPGLAPFQERDAHRFFGREHAVAQVVTRLAEEALIAIVGPSGAGKSSFVRAGVIPALKRDDAWEAFIVRPGVHPLTMLAELLGQHAWTSSTPDDITPEVSDDDGPPELDRDTLRERLRGQPGLFGALLRARAQRRRERIVLLVDQCEELYTLAAPNERRAFWACLAGAVDDTGSPVRVMLALRSDFLDRMADAPAALLEAMSHNTILIRPLDREGLRSALIKPAATAEHRFESDALVDEMLDALAHTQGALPLLQFTAAELWEQRDRQRRVLTLDSYRALGGVAGALASHADAVLGSMTGAERKWVRALMLRLVTHERTRAIVTVRELREPGGEKAAELARVLARLIDARLLTVEGGDQEQATVEIVHESLIDCWPQLARWLDEERESAQFLGRVRSAAQDWEASGQAEGLLWRGEPAREAQRWFELHHADGNAILSRRERAFLEAVIVVRTRSRRRRRELIGVSFVALSAAVAISANLAWQEGRAKRAAQQATLTARDATRLAAARLRGEDPTTQLAVLREIEGRAPLPDWRAETQRVLHAGVALAVFEAHSGSVRAVAFSPDGRRVASASDDQTVRVWNADGSGQTLMLSGHAGDVTGVAFSPDGRRIASASADRAVRIWDAEGTSPPRVLIGHTANVKAVAFSPDGRRIASASEDGTVRVWSVDGVGQPFVLRGHTDRFQTVAFSPDGWRIAAAGVDKSIRVWKADGSAPPLVLTGHTDTITGVDFSPDGQHIASASSDRTLRVWNADGSGRPLVFTGHTNGVCSVAFSHDGRHIASASFDKTVRVWNTDGAGPPLVLIGHASPVYGVAFSPDGKRVASASNDSTARVWNVDDAKAPSVLRGHTDVVDGVAFSPDGERVASASDDWTVRVWNADGSAPPLVLAGHTDPVYSVAFSPDGKRVASASHDGTARVWNADGSGQTLVLRGHSDGVFSIAFSRDGHHLVTGSWDRTVRVWNTDGSGQPVVLSGHDNAVLAVAFSPDGRHVASSSADKTVRVWNADGSGAPVVLAGHAHLVLGVAFSPDGRRVVSGSKDRTVRVWNADGSGQPLVLLGHTKTVNGVAFSPDGRHIASTSDDQTVRIWNSDGTGEPTVLAGHLGAVNMVAFSPDGRRLASGSSDNTVRVWRDLEPVTADDPRPWTATSYCLSVELRKQLLGVSDEVARALHQRCHARVAAAFGSGPQE